MVILKKVRAASLVEILVASVIIVAIFLIASMSVNNVFKGAILGNDDALQNRIKELNYLNKNEKIEIPFYEETDQWEITIEYSLNQLYLKTTNKISSKELQIIIDEDF